MTLSAELHRVLEWLAEESPSRHPAVSTRARMVLLDTVGCMVAGLQKPEPLAKALGV